MKRIFLLLLVMVMFSGTAFANKYIDAVRETEYGQGLDKSSEFVKNSTVWSIKGSYVVGHVIYADGSGSADFQFETQDLGYGVFLVQPTWCIANTRTGEVKVKASICRDFLKQYAMSVE